MAQEDITEDALLGGQIRIRQPAKGYRVNIDTMLLAAFVPLASAGSGPLIELGCGVGAALIAVAKAHEQQADGQHQFVGLEQDADYARLARENVRLNGLEHCVRIVEADLFHPPADLTGFSRVFFNPPYDEAGEGRAPAPERQAAHIEQRPVEDWIKLWANRMSAQSSLTLIHRAHRLGDILAALEGRLGGVGIVPVRPEAKARAQRVIVTARKGSRAPLQLWPGLDLHPEDHKQKFTPEVEALLRGQARALT